MPYEIVITGELVEEREYTKRNIMPLKDFLPHLTEYASFELMPLPSNTRYLRVDPGRDEGLQASVITQIDPAVHQILFKNAPASDTYELEENYRIMLPYLYFYFRMTSSTMFTSTAESVIWTPTYWGVLWGNQPLTSFDVPAAPCMMPNCYDTGEVCSGTVSVDASDKLGQWVDTAVNTFLTSSFNMDLRYPWPYRSMPDWEAATEKDPTGWMDWDIWKENLPSLGEKLDNINSADWPEVKPSAVDDTPIPPIQQAPSFYNVRRWLDGLDSVDRDRLIQVARRYDEE